jgi:hypothetical protein
MPRGSREGNRETNEFNLLFLFHLVFNSRDVSIPLDMTKATSPESQISAVISDRECRTHIHRTLRRFYFFWCLGLFREMNGGFIAIVSDEIWCFFKTKSAQRAVRVHIPLPGHVLGLFA